MLVLLSALSCVLVPRDAASAVHDIVVPSRGEHAREGALESLLVVTSQEKEKTRSPKSPNCVVAGIKKGCLSLYACTVERHNLERGDAS